jgi:adenosylcobinamide-GDP ribazoletransferase
MRENPSLHRELSVFFAALTFFTRIPAPGWAAHSPEILNRSSRYFPLVGILVGALSAGVFWVSHLFLPQPVSVLLSMVASLVVTGAFHEDGFADVCDGFGGGWDRMQILTIMKDSRIGAFGTIGVTLLLLLKFASLSEVPAGLLPMCIVAGHSTSRACSVALIYRLRYVRENEDSRAKPLATEISGRSLLISFLLGLLPLFFLRPVFLGSLLPLALGTAWLGRFFRERIGGYTGDCLGAVQQVTEVVFYLYVLVLTWNST